MTDGRAPRSSSLADLLMFSAYAGDDQGHATAGQTRDWLIHAEQAAWDRHLLLARLCEQLEDLGLDEDRGLLEQLQERGLW